MGRRPSRETDPDQSTIRSRPLPTIIDTRSLHAVAAPPAPRRRPPRQTIDDQDERRHAKITRRDMVLRLAGGVVATAAGLGVIAQLPAGKQIIKKAQQTFAPVKVATPTAPTPVTALGGKLPFGYFHGCFEVNTPDEIGYAAAVGINYVINYADASWDTANPDTAMGKQMLKYKMKTFLNVEWPFLKCSNGYGKVDEEGIRNLVARFHTSPLVAGYWIKDDDCGDQGVAIQGIYNLIRSIDKDPTHLIMPGFGDAGSVGKNYYHGCADLIGFYPYPAYSRGPAAETADMLNIVRSRTPQGLQPPPFIGIYQAFATPPYRPVLPVSEVVDGVKAFMDAGAAGVAAFGWEAPNEDFIIGNNQTLHDAVVAVTKWLGDNGYGSVGH